MRVCDTTVLSSYWLRGVYTQTETWWHLAVLTYLNPMLQGQIKEKCPCPQTVYSLIGEDLKV